ncbi:GNAT family N-acetyltransferase [Niabella hibiscisoli]|uniref:GNAT family N-acetyltransferase n=1 Tax=Niabella hibiscisoli TaxID=1825928 RepID=UPI001F0F5682|nr:GNAT family N-acetyltransferase [Niabella hibiscisoli]MCH5721234.1 GNAT family N-acetyltransferase [Niabella hibiscisoli]
MLIQRITIEQVDLVTDLFNQYRIFYKQASDIPLAEAFLKERLSNNESVIFVAIINEQPAGFTQLYPTYSSMRVSKNWILNDLYVEAGQRKQGIGAALIEAAMAFARNDGASYLALSTAVDNYTAQKLYESIGFIKQEPDTAFFDYRIALK